MINEFNELILKKVIVTKGLFSMKNQLWKTITSFLLFDF